MTGILLKCAYSPAGCEWRGCLAEMEEHAAQCDSRTIECKWCAETVPHATSKEHERTCASALHDCPLAKVGCPDAVGMSRDELRTHMEESKSSHLERLVTLIPSITLLPGGRAKLSNLHGEGGSTSGVTIDLSERDRDGPAAFGSTRHAGPPEIQADEDEDNESKTLRTSLRAAEQKIKRLTVECNAMHLRLSTMENVTYDGTMVWKIPEVAQRMRDSESGKYTSLFSLPFYTGRCGYRLCMRIYLRGDGTAKGSHTSIFVIVMKGEFDAILKWPFAQVVRFKLIAQRPGGVDVNEAILPQPHCISFARPKSEMNIASGIPKFVTIDELMMGPYVVDNTMFIKCKVETAGIWIP